MKISYIFPLLLTVVFLGQGCITPAQPTSETPEPETNTVMEKTENAKTKNIKTMGGAMLGVVEDVSGGNGFGDVAAIYLDGQYMLEGVFQNIPDPKRDDFYEGWIVRRGENMSVISTGKVNKQADGTWLDTFSTSQNLSDHDFYVLTLEPNDGDPAPAKHILEGTLK